jgi:hypothetical protein
LETPFEKTLKLDSGQRQCGNVLKKGGLDLTTHKYTSSIFQILTATPILCVVDSRDPAWIHDGDTVPVTAPGIYVSMFQKNETSAVFFM